MSDLRLARRLRAVLALTVALLVGLAMFAPAAAAHDVLIESDPADGDALAEVPDEIILTFNNEPLDMGNALTLADGDGATVTEVEGVATGRDVIFDLSDAEVPAGELAASWRVVSSDGHPIEGTLTFSAESGTLTNEEAPAPEPTDAPEPVEATTEAPEQAETAAPGAEDAEDAAGSTSLNSLPTWVKILIALAALGAVVTLIVFAARRLREDRSR